MFRRRDSQDSVDVNDFIVGDNLSAAGAIPPHTSAPQAPSLDIRDDDILEADYAHTDPAPKTRLRKSKIAVLLVCAIFAAGGVASIFIEEPHASTALGIPQAAPQSTPAEVNLPPGLTAPVAETTTAALQLPAGQEQSTDSQRPPDGTTVPPAAAMAAPEQAPNAAPAPSQTATPASIPSQSPPAVVATAAPPAGSSASTASQAVAKTPSAPAVASAAAPVATPVAAPVTSGSTSKPSSSDQKSAPAPAPAKKIVVSVKAVAPQVSKPTAPTTAERDHTEETVKRLVSVSAEAFGLQAIQEGSITLEPKRGQASQRLHVGDRLPSGEQLLRIDARSMTLVTDRSVIRIN